MDSQQPTINAEETEILQEIMNIAFGNAAAELAEVISIFVVLSIPSVKLIKAPDLPGYLRTEVSGYDKISIVEQNFWGEFKGSAFLVFQSGAGKELTSLLGSGGDDFTCESCNEFLERETLMEVGNILIGACVGKVAELLSDVVTYSPPRVIIDDNPNDAIPASLFPPTYSAITLKTLFRFKERNVEGFLFLLTSQESIGWLSQALERFMGQYG